MFEISQGSVLQSQNSLLTMGFTPPTTSLRARKNLSGVQVKLRQRLEKVFIAESCECPVAIFGIKALGA